MRRAAGWVVGYDGSDQANDALALGRLLARALDAEVVAACVYPAGTYFAYKGIEVAGDELRLAADRQLAAAPGDGALRRELVVSASPARGLISFAESQRGMDLLVVGSREYGPVRRVLLGSVASELLHAAACPVIVCPRGAHPDTVDVPPDAKSSETSSQR